MAHTSQHVLEESTRVATEASRVAGLPTFVPGAIVQDGSIIRNPAVVSSRMAEDQIKKDQQFVDQFATQSIAETMSSPSIVTAKSTDPNMQSAIKQINEFLNKPEINRFITPEIRNQIADINATNIQSQALAASARNALQAGDVRSLNERAEALRRSQERQNQLFQSFIEQSRPLQERAIALALPSVAETDIKKQLADIRTSTELGAEQQLGVGRPLAISIGRSEKVLRQGLAIERNVLEKLGLAQEARQAEREAVRLGQQSLFQNLELAQKALDQQSKEEDKFLDIALKFNDRQRQVLADILDTFKGADPDQLLPEVQAQIGSLAASQGIPPSVVQLGLEKARSREVIEQQTKQLQLLRAQAGSGMVPISRVGIAIPSVAITPDRLSPIAKAVFDGTIKLTDITPTQRAQIAPELNAIGYTSSVTTESKQLINNVRNGLRDVIEKWKAVPGRFKGTVQGRLARITRVEERKPSVASFTAAQRIVGQQLTRLFEKGVISDSDRAFYQSLIPNLNQGKLSVVESSVKSIEERLSQQITNQISTLQTGLVESNRNEEEYIDQLSF